MGLRESLARSQPALLGDGEFEDGQELPLEGTVGPGGPFLELGDQILGNVLDEQVDSHGAFILRESTGHLISRVPAAS